MKVQKFNKSDLGSLPALQPDSWPDIRINFNFYLKYNFSYPAKIVNGDGELVAVGSSIVFDKSAWLAHIIVHPSYRRRGLAKAIMESLLDDLWKKKIRTCLLIATEDGFPLYKKLGFKVECDYIFLNRKKSGKLGNIPKEIQSFKSHYYPDIMKMDYEVSGENRSVLLKDYLSDAILYVYDNQLTGFYLPSLGEGLLIAKTELAGRELMKIKFSDTNKIALPSKNSMAVNFLKENDFEVRQKKGWRMSIGENINWKPGCIYSRIGGNMG